MGSTPPKIVETVVGVFIPTACREEVLGDLHERYTSKLHYFRDALLVVPMVIMSRIRRTADQQVLLMEGLVFYLSYMGSAWFLNKSFLNQERGFLKLAIPASIILVGLILEDAYAAPGKRSPLKAMHGILTVLAAAYLIQALLLSRSSALAIPLWIMQSGSAVSLLLGSMLRLLFPPVTDRPLGASGPAFWLKHGAEPSETAGAASAVIRNIGLIVLVALLGSWIGGSSLMISLIWLSAFVLLIHEAGKRS
jgi:hypothetical protein